MIKFITKLLILLVIGMYSDRSYCQSIYGKKLETADTIRSKNVPEFLTIISALNKNIHKLNKEQVEKLKYLNAYSKSIQGDLVSATSEYERILQNSSSSAIKVRALNALINTFGITGEWEKGLEKVQNAKNLIKMDNYKEYRTEVYVVISIFYNLLSEFELGLKYAEEAASSIKKTDTRTECFAKHQIIEAYFGIGNFKSLKRKIKKIINTCENSNENIVSAILKSIYAKVLLKENRETLALKYLNLHLESVKETRYSIVLSVFYSLIAKSNYELSEFDEAHHYASLALKESNGKGNIHSNKDALYVIFKHHERNRNFDEAIEYFDRYSTADKEYLDKTRAKKLAVQLANLKAEEQKAKIELLSRQNELLKTEKKVAGLEAQNNRLFILLLVAIISLLMLWAVRGRMVQRRLRHIAHHDSLTHCYNRGHFTQLANSAIKHGKRAQQDLCLIMFDLDYFKQINDTHGHSSGDYALKSVAEVCKKMGRKNDIFARIGGEEFVFLLPGCDLTQAVKLAEQCRTEIEKIDTRLSGKDFRITASFGISESQVSGFHLERLLVDADKAMYHSKANGRNQVTCFDTDYLAQSQEQMGLLA